MRTSRHWGVNRMYYGTDARIGEIAIGALLALAVDRFRILEHTTPVVNRAVAYVQVPALALAGWAVHRTTETTSWLFRGGLLELSLCWAVLILGAVLEVGVFRYVSRVRPLGALGVISYGVYLVHWPLLLALHPFHSTHLDAAVALTASLAVAIVSYRFFERPIRSGALPQPARLALRFSGVTVFASLALVAIAPIATPTVGSLTSHADAASTGSAPSPTTPGHAKPLRVLIVGDSTSVELGKTIASLPGLVVDARGEGGCAFVDAGTQSMVKQGIFIPQPASCRHWGARMPSERAFDPDVVLAIFGPTQASDVTLGDGSARTNIANADEQAAVRLEAASLRNDFPNALFIWASAPRIFAGTQQFPERDWLTNDPVRTAGWNMMVAELSSQPHSARLDLAPFIENTPPGGWRDRTWRPDGTHLKGKALTTTAVGARPRDRHRRGRTARVHNHDDPSAASRPALDAHVPLIGFDRLARDPEPSRRGRAPARETRSEVER